MTSVAAYRIFKAKRAATAMTGEGAAREGGRWNLPRISVVYSSSSLALAQLAVLVHLSGISPPATYPFVQLTIPATCAIQEIPLQDLESLPFDWRSYPPHGLLQQIGDDGVNAGLYPALKVPSAVSPNDLTICSIQFIPPSQTLSPVKPGISNGTSDSLTGRLDRSEIVEYLFQQSSKVGRNQTVQMPEQRQPKVTPTHNIQMRP